MLLGLENSLSGTPIQRPHCSQDLAKFLVDPIEASYFQAHHSNVMGMTGNHLLKCFLF